MRQSKDKRIKIEADKIVFILVPVSVILDKKIRQCHEKNDRIIIYSYKNQKATNTTEVNFYMWNMGNTGTLINFNVMYICINIEI